MFDRAGTGEFGTKGGVSGELMKSEVSNGEVTVTGAASVDGVASW